MNISFENKVALVAGDGSGLGLATARAFTESGASVALPDIDEAPVCSAADELISKRKQSGGAIANCSSIDLSGYDRCADHG